MAVSPDEPFLHCLRNRYFLEYIERLIQQNDIELMINFGSGFSMYPFLLPNHLNHLEIDQKLVVDYKKKKIRKWMTEGTLPSRRIQFIAQDFRENMLDLQEKLSVYTHSKRSMIILEGVLFFLSNEDTDRLIQLFRNIQRTGSYLGCVSFIPEIEKTNCFQRLLSFYRSQVDAEKEAVYQTIPHSYYEKLPGYQCIDHEDYVSLSKKYSTRKIKNADSILNEHMYILEKI